jgi:hypothetical protein
VSLKLTEGNGIAALAEPTSDWSTTTIFCNAWYTVGARAVRVTDDEVSWFMKDAASERHSMNRSLALAPVIDEVVEVIDPAPSAEGYKEYAEESARLSEASLGAAFEVLPPE